MGYVIRRLPQLIVVLFAVTLLTFLSLNLLGDPLKAILGPQYADRELREQVREDLNLQDPIPIRYVQWLGDAATGDLGRSYNTRESVSSILSARIPVSALLMVYAQTLALLIALPIGIFAAAKADTKVDKTTTTVTFAFVAIPSFALGVILLYFFAVQNDIFPSRYLDDSFQNQLYSLFLPALTLALPAAATYTRLLRADMINTLQEDFITTAKSKGMSTRRILFRHALRPSSFSLITVFGLTTGALLGGALVVENIFSIPGLGKAVVDAIFRKDYLVVQAVVLIVAFAYVIVNFVVDALYTLLDPRVRALRAH